VQFCQSGEFWGECKNMVLPTIEVCGDGRDNDCDGEVDEACTCTDGERRPCYTGDPRTRGIGECRAGTEACDDGAWAGACDGEVLPAADEPCGSTKDLDCDGLAGGVVNACGKCGEPCYDEHYDNPGDCTAPGRTCNGTEQDPGDPKAVTLGQAQLNAPFIYIAQHEANKVVKLDTLSGQRLWEVSSHGTYPSRTAVAYDYSVWVGNRGFGNPLDPAQSNVVHLDLDGNLICRADVTGIARGLAIDADGFVWAGTWNAKRLYKINGSLVDQTPEGPRCRIEATYDVGVSMYGLAVDGRGYLYACSLPTILRMDTRTGTFDNTIPLSACYGVTVSPKDGRVWYGSYHQTGCVNGMNPDPPYDKIISSVGCGGIVSGVTVDHEGYVWASSYQNGNVYKIDPATGAEICHALSPCTPGASAGCDARGVAEDSAGKIWVVNLGGGYANRFNRDCSHDQTIEIHAGVNTYTYSDMTGMQLRTVTTKEGHWVQDFDTGYASPIWYSAEWSATAPPNTGVEVTFKAADTEGGLQSSPTAPCGPFATPPADLTTCPQLNGHRWLEADVRLWTKQDGVRPKFSDLKLYWARP
jgi:streptogramin lyase